MSACMVTFYMGCLEDAPALDIIPYKMDQAHY